MKNFAKNRKDIYGLLSSLYARELDTKGIEEMRSNGIFDLLSEAGGKIDIDRLKKCPIAELAEELACEYTALFLGPGKHIYPFESAYVTEEDRGFAGYWGKCAVDMKNMIKQYGLEIKNDAESIPDHISVELEFMKKILEREIMAWEDNNEEDANRSIEFERWFFNNHLNKWAQRFCEEVSGAAKDSFYGEIARMTSSFLKEEEKVLMI